jgi:hypothetical protein
MIIGFFVVLGVELRGLLFHLSYASSPFFMLVTFDIGSCFMCRPALTMILLLVLLWRARMTNGCHHIQPLVEMGSHKLPRLALNYNPPNLHLQSS